MKITKLFILITMFNLCFSAPRRFYFTCNKAQVEKNFERFITVSNSSDINAILRRSLQYFNVSLLYKDVLMDRIKTYCFSIKS